MATFKPISDSQSIKDGLSVFRSQLDEEFTSPKASLFVTLISHHGEVQVNLASGAVHSIHMGDKGVLNDAYIVYADKEGQLVCIFWDQVESIWFHLGYKD